MLALSRRKSNSCEAPINTSHLLYNSGGHPGSAMARTWNTERFCRVRICRLLPSHGPEMNPLRVPMKLTPII